MAGEDLRPKARKEWIEKFRKVKPPASTPAGSAQSISSKQKDSGNARRFSITSGLEPYTGPWGESQMLHLLRRTLFGVQKSDLNLLKPLSLDDAVDHILTLSPLPAPPVNDFNGSDNGAVDPTVPSGETWIEAPYSNEYEGYRITSLKGWLIRHILNQPVNIGEKMIFFWHNLLVTQSWDVFISKASFRYFDLLRKNALGNYKVIIKALTVEPAMLLYLNGNSNNKEAPDENYGRELQELFCVGKGPGSQYTEGDVQAAARVLTGWVVDWNSFGNQGPMTSFFYPDNHETSDKHFSSFYNNKIITGKSGEEGAGELEELIDMIFDTQEAARYICRRLYSFFVYGEIDATTEQNVITPLAEIFRSGNYEILPVLRTLFRSAHFYDDLNRGALIKSPVEHALGVWKSLGMKSPNETDLLLNYQINSSLLWHMASMGLEIGDPPNVAGWPPYYQAPQYDQSWITTATITTRAITTDSMIYWGFWISQELQLNADLLEFVKKLDDPSNPVSLLTESASLLLGLELSENELNNLKGVLLTGQQTDAYWTLAWNAFIDEPGNNENRLIVQTRLQSTFQRLLQLGEYQLM